MTSIDIVNCSLAHRSMPTDQPDGQSGTNGHVEPKDPSLEAAKQRDTSPDALVL